jgi:hypothetical protein
VTRERIAENEIDRLLRVEGELRAQVAQLRGLLKEVHAWMDDEWEAEFKAKIARALGLKP